MKEKGQRHVRRFARCLALNSASGLIWSARNSSTAGR